MKENCENENEIMVDFKILNRLRNKKERSNSWVNEIKWDKESKKIDNGLIKRRKNDRKKYVFKIK